MDVAMDKNISMVVRLKWCAEALTRHMAGKWSKPQAADVGKFLEDLAHAFWLEEEDFYINLGREEEQTPIQQREAIRQKLNEIGSDALPQLRSLYVTQCDSVIQNLSSNLEEVEYDGIGRIKIEDGAARVMKNPVEVTVMSNKIVLYLLRAIRANLEESPQKGSCVSLPLAPGDPRRETHVQSLLRQLVQL
jgi:hypothetical protein